MIRPLLYERQLVTKVQRELASAQQFQVATAMVSVAGVEWIHRSIEQCMEKGGSGRILFGIDLPSDPKAIERLRDIATEYSGQLELKYFRPLKNRIFHPKLFLFRTRSGKTSAIIGSSNLTGGGLTENYEANVWVQTSALANELADYFDEHFEGAYSSRVTSEWIASYRKEWQQRKKLLDRLRRLRQKSQAIARKHVGKSYSAKRIKGYRLAFTGGISDWPRSSRLYPLVRRLGGEIVEIKQISTANCLIHAELMGGRKTTRKLRGARHFHIPIITEEDFWALVRKEETIRRRRLKVGVGSRKTGLRH
jgi:HKD family nuclease